MMTGFSSLFPFLLVAIVATSLAPATAADSGIDLRGLQYRSIGPAISGGRVTAVAGSDADPLFYLAGGADGGVFATTDGGLTWSPIFDSADSAAIGAIAVAPQDRRDIWVGTGESNPRNDVAMGDGIWHTRDGGKTWRHLGLVDAGAISCISIDPRNPGRVVVGVLGQVFRDSRVRGVYVTGDAGAHWQQTLYAGESTGVSDIARVSGRPDTLLAGLYEVRRRPWTLVSGGSQGGVFRSDDGGATWRHIVGNGLPSPPTGRIGLAAGSGRRLYGIIQSKSGDLWRSDDAGLTWHVLPRSPLVGARPFYFSRITVDPANPDHLISAGSDLSLSTDAGRSFHRIAPNAGWDYHVVWWSADGRRVAVGTDEGFILSGDGGSVWSQPYGLPLAQPYHVGFDDALPNYHVCVGLQDNNQWCGAANADSGLGVLNRDWHLVGPGDGMWVLYDPADPNIVWSTSTNDGTGQVFVWDARTRQAYDVSPDSELNWVPARTLAYRFNWNSPLAFTSDGAALVGGNVIFKTIDRGQHWSVISPDLTRDDKSHQQIPGGPVNADISGAEISDTLLSLAPSPVDAATIWAGTDDGLVQLSRDGGAHWIDVTPRGAPHWGRVATIDASRTGANTAFVAVDNHMLGDDSPHVFATDDFGARWSSISGDLPGTLFVRTIRQDPVDPKLLYAGTQRGVWASWDRGAHWRSLRLNMPASAIYDLAIQPERDDLIVASHGRGVWIFDDVRALQELGSVHPAAPTLFAPRDSFRWWQWTDVNSFASGDLPANVFAGPNVEYGVLITYWLPAGVRRAASIAIEDGSGRIVRRLADVPRQPGFHRTSWDLTEDGPAKWLGTYKQNQGPDSGAEVLPGTYTIRLKVDGFSESKPAVVKADPRDPQTPDQMRSRYQTLSTLYAQVGDVDTMLNAIDRRLPQAAGNRRASLLALRGRLTGDPHNVEDLGIIAQLRERLLDLISRISSNSYQAPTQSQLQTAAQLRATYSSLLQAYHRLP